jgi:hypothetical protein
MPIVANDTQLPSCRTISATDLFRAVVAQTQRDPKNSVSRRLFCAAPQGRPDISMTKSWHVVVNYDCYD